MVCNTLRAAASVLAEHMATKRDQSISVNVMPEVIRRGSVLHEVCEADPRLILCIKTLQLQVEDYGLWAKLILQVEYTNTLSSSVVRVESISELREATIYAASLHRRNLLIVYPAHLHEQIQGKKSNLLESHQLLNCYVSGLSSEIKRMEECRYMAQVIRFQYSCSYREWTDRKAKITEKINEIVRQAKLSGIEDWKKAYAVVRYCVNNWHYGRIENSTKLEYTAYSAIINNTAVCMGISLAICSIFKELGMDYSGTPGEYIYSHNATGKSASGIIANGSTSERDLGAQRSAGGADRQAGDQGGHLIADRFGGRNDPTNLDAQAANVNQKDQANVERNVANLAANPNNTVSMNVSNFNSVGERPDATMINVGVQDNTTGAIDEQHISFQNASHEMQQSWNDTANQADQTVDSSQNAGMTDEQIDIANDLCGAEDDVDDRLGSGWEHTDFDTSFLDAGITESEAPASAEVSSGESEGASEGVGEDNSGEGGSGGEDDGLGE